MSVLDGLGTGVAFGDGRGLGSLLGAVVVVAAAPIVVAFLPGRVPQVVLLIAGGIVIGPEVLELAEPDDITLFANLGLGFLFLLAGYELDPSLLRERAGTTAIVAWVISDRARDRGRGSPRSRGTREGVPSGGDRTHDDGARHAAPHPP